MKQGISEGFGSDREVSAQKNAPFVPGTLGASMSELLQLIINVFLFSERTSLKFYGNQDSVSLITL